jgi:hypothetical protein
MRRRLPLLLLPIAAGLGAQPPDIRGSLFDGHRLHALCRHTDPARADSPSSDRYAARCQGYVSGVLDAALRFSDQRPCLPDWLGPAQLADIVTRYLAAHPERLHRPAADLVFEALAESFGTIRCP